MIQRNDVKIITQCFFHYQIKIMILIIFSLNIGNGDVKKV